VRDLGGIPAVMVASSDFSRGALNYLAAEGIQHLTISLDEASGLKMIPVIERAFALDNEFREVSGHLVEALRRGDAEPFLAENDLPYEEWLAVMKTAIDLFPKTASLILFRLASDHYDDSIRFNAIQLLDGDELAVARLMTIELQAADIGHDRLQQRLTLGERQARRVAAVEMQKVEGVKDQAHAPCPVGRGLGFSEARHTVGADAAQFAVEIGGLRPHGPERRRHAGISGCPVEAGARQKLGLAALDARRHAKTVELDLMQPLRPRRGLFDQLCKLRRYPLRKGQLGRHTGQDRTRHSICAPRPPANRCTFRTGFPGNYRNAVDRSIHPDLLV
jgi:hypothetical protein